MQNRSQQAGCWTYWDGINCWPRAEFGQVVNISCSEVSSISPATKTSYLSTFRQVYTVGYATSLISLITAIVTACKSAVAFFQFSILANYFWLLVEGMYLQTLLALTFVSQRKYFWWYILIGWGLPSTVIILWVLTRFFYDDNGRLAKSTLFLIPLFGMHYTVFAFLPENTGVAARLYIELGLGSFQGFVVALLYCFMNGEVQAELRRWLWRCHNQNQLTPAKRSITQITIRTRGELGGPPSTGNVSSV
ncbi:hypothetical protein WMY93_021466 [Mugilogobius chulae]|uniref:Uncharacterized protein n=1 Tax=Mugilogobius chulae TaxID=88201 RepID=A0AAW0NN79_9GOBI